MIIILHQAQIRWFSFNNGIIKHFSYWFKLTWECLIKTIKKKLKMIFIILFPYFKRFDVCLYWFTNLYFIFLWTFISNRSLATWFLLKSTISYKCIWSMMAVIVIEKGVLIFFFFIFFRSILMMIMMTKRVTHSLLVHYYHLLLSISSTSLLAD